MKHLFITIFIVILYFPHAYAQQFFTPGYVVTTQHDTLRGEIREKGNTAILLRTTSKTQERSYTPDQILSYTTEGVNHMSILLPEGGTTKPLFVRERIKGYVSLYSLSSPEGELAYVLQLPDQSFVPLRGKMAWTVLNRNLLECTDPNFMARLESNRFFYDYAYFEQIVTAYNRCTKPDKSSEQPKSSFHYEVGPLLGIAHNRLNYTFIAANLFLNPNGLYPAYNTFVAGGFITLMPQKRLSLTVEALFTNYKGGRTSLVTSPVDPTVRETRYYSFQEQFLTLPITGRYVFLDRSVRWYVKGGVGFTYSLALKGQISGSNIVDSDIQMRNGISIAYLLGLGVEIPLTAKRHLYAEIRTMPHLVKDGSTHIGDCRSGQLIIGIPLLIR